YQLGYSLFASAAQRSCSDLCAAFLCADVTGAGTFEEMTA
ncbi:MAG: hypothetical protein ACI853_002269, partial [Paracoccaceae bacterium]